MHRESAVAVLTLNRPQAGNTIDMALARDLEAQVDAALGDPTVRCIVLTGSGKLFCGGGDIGAIAAAGSDAGTFLYDLANALHRSVKKLASGAKPVVTLINGPAAGAGLSLAIAGDVALASTSAHFSAAYGLVGLTPDGGMSWLLPRLVGLRRAQEIILTNCRVSAADAAAMGLITRVVAPENLMGEGLAVAHALANGPLGAIGGARALLAQGFGNDLATQLDLEATRIAEAGTTAEAQEGIGAFLTRRTADFVGSTSLQL
jgi:2-(1,2-epoxy-1,2-dihydrophenyl)acetyl-CoA isomerase